MPISRDNLTAFINRLTPGTHLIRERGPGVMPPGTFTVIRWGRSTLRIMGEEGRTYWLVLPTRCRDVASIKEDSIEFFTPQSPQSAIWRIVP